LKPSGYFNTKAQCLRNYCQWYIAIGEFSRLELLVGDAGYETLRQQLETGLQTDVAVFNEYMPCAYRTSC